jgi:glycosyltransferase involved in cell wall biosynthesis
MTGATFTERIRQTARLLRSEGSAGVARRVLVRAGGRLPLPSVYDQLAIDREDLLRVAELAGEGRPAPGPLRERPTAPLTVSWVCFAPTAGSGGHTTLFRMVSALERAGHRCILYLRNDHGWSIDSHRRTIRTWWPDVKAEVRDLADGIEDADAIVATAWQTAYSVLGSPAKGTRFYFVQDFEPLFYPAGSEALLAEATFRFGFHHITAGAWLAERLRAEYGVPADHFEFGCDLDRYHLARGPEADSARTGVCYYCRPSTPRRAHEMAVMALDLFAARHPEVDIHVFGEPIKGLPFRTVEHGIVTPSGLNDIYNRCVAGLALSATNASLVPHEMLAAGCLPIVNDADHNRIVLDNPHVVYAPSTPFGLASALSCAIERPGTERASLAARAAESVRSRSWDEAGAAVEAVICRVVQAGVRSGAAVAA